jgi:hypothetical protein
MQAILSAWCRHRGGRVRGSSLEETIKLRVEHSNLYQCTFLLRFIVCTSYTLVLPPTVRWWSWSPLSSLLLSEQDGHRALAAYQNPQTQTDAHRRWDRSHWSPEILFFFIKWDVSELDSSVPMKRCVPSECDDPVQRFVARKSPQTKKLRCILKPLTEFEKESDQVSCFCIKDWRNEFKLRHTILQTNKSRTK